MSVYISTGAFDSANLAEILDLCSRHSLTGIELSSGIGYHADIELLIQRASQQGPVLIHNYFPAPATPFVLNLASQNTEVIARSMQLCKNAIDVCAAFHVPFYSVHSGFRLELQEEALGDVDAQEKLGLCNAVPFENAFNIFAGNVFELCQYAQKRGIRLLLENNVVAGKNLDKAGTPLFLMSTPEDITRLFTELNENNLGLLLDVGHLNVTAKTMGFDRDLALRTLAPYIEAFHLSENDGYLDSNLPVHSDSWFLSHLSNFPQATVVLEAYRLSITEIFQQRDLISRHLSTESKNDNEINSRQHSVLS